MVTLDKSALASMTQEELDAHILEVCFAKKEADLRIASLDTPIGKELLDRLRLRLDNVRLTYSSIAVKGKDDRDIVMAFVELRTMEKLLRDEVGEIEKAEQIKEELDSYHMVCEDVNRARRESNRTRR